MKDKIKTKAILTCPKCNAQQEVEIPTNACLPFFKCSSCSELISTPQDSQTCCVVCAYSEDKCPVSTVK